MLIKIIGLIMIFGCAIIYFTKPTVITILVENNNNYFEWTCKTVPYYKAMLECTKNNCFMSK